MRRRLRAPLNPSMSRRRSALVSEPETETVPSGASRCGRTCRFFAPLGNGGLWAGPNRIRERDSRCTMAYDQLPCCRLADDYPAAARTTNTTDLRASEPSRASAGQREPPAMARADGPTQDLKRASPRSKVSRIITATVPAVKEVREALQIGDIAPDFEAQDDDGPHPLP